MPPVRVCLFCEASGKLTSAHLISQSLQRLLPASSDGTDRMEWWVDESELTEKTNRQFINVHAANHQVRRLCHSCNGNWMAAFEDATRALLLDLYHGRPVTLDSTQQADLATWATIVSMLRATQDRGKAMLADADAAAVRLHNAPPPGYEVWLVHGENPAKISMRHYRGSIGDRQGWLGWIWMGASVLVVTSAHLVPLSSRRLRLLPEAAVQLHPARRQVINWPPANEVTRESLYDLLTLHA